MKQATDTGYLAPGKLATTAKKLTRSGREEKGYDTGGESRREKKGLLNWLLRKPTA